MCRQLPWQPLQFSRMGKSRKAADGLVTASGKKVARTPLNAIIIVDSNDDFKLLLSTLESCDFVPHCVKVKDQTELGAKLTEQPWDIVICSQELLANDSFATLKIVRQYSSDLPFIIVAQNISTDVAVVAMREGASDYVLKSDLQRLIPAIWRELLVTESRRQGQRKQQEAMETKLAAVDRFNGLAAAIPEFVWVLDLTEKKMTYVSAAYEKIWGRRVQDLLDDRWDWLRHVHPDDKLRMKNARNRAGSGGLDEEFRVVRADGSIRWLHLTTFPIYDKSGHVNSIGGVASDITGFIEQRDKLRANVIEQRHLAEMQRFILDALPASIAILDTEGTIFEVNESWRKFADSNEYDYHAVGENYLLACDTAGNRDEIDEKDALEAKQFAAEIRTILSGDNQSVSHIYTPRNQEQQRWFRVSATPLRTVTMTGAVIMYIDVTETIIAEQRLLQLANFDSLTSLPNRVLFRDRLDTALALSRRNEWSLALCFIDLDRFKAVNDTLGHLVGDQLLKEVGNRLRYCVRDCDTVSRLGSDEFAVILPELVDQQGSAQVAQRIIDVLSEPIILDGNNLFITASIGITLFPADAEDPDILIRNADTAMYRAKESGRNNYQFFTSEMNAHAMEVMNLERDLRHAIEHQEFLLYYQPKVSCSSGKIVGFEALLRWQHPLRGLVSPAEFVPLLEETGLIVPVGEWVLHTACAQARAWQDAGLGALSIAVNVSGQQIRGHSLCETVSAALAACGLPARYLELELTESYLMGDAEGIIATLRELKAMGVTLSVDDFGTGYSSLAYLKRFPLDSLKVDRAFVQDITADPGDVSITRAIITLAHSFKLQVVAEGVETEGQLGLLIANHCDVIQGYFFSRPLPTEQIIAMLHEGRSLPAQLLIQQKQRERSLLLVEDKERTLSALERLLSREHYTIFTAIDAKQGFELLARNNVDVIIANQRMPGLSGVEFLRRVKTLHPESVRMVLSERSDLQVMTEAINEGAIHKFITKPWDDAVLRANIEEAFSSREMADENRLLQHEVDTANNELAQLNEQLKQLLAAKELQVKRDEISLDIAQEVLQYLPWPIIGIDNENMIAFANAAADSLCAEHAPLITSFAEESLPSKLVEALAQFPVVPDKVTINDISFRLRCTRMGGHSRSKGILMMLLPENTA